MEQQPVMPPAAQPAPVKKGMPAIAWLGIGCGGLILIGLIVGGILFSVFSKKMKEFAANPEKAGAEMMVSMNPDLEKVSQDDTKGEMTIRTKDGEEVTLSYKDISEGRITVKDKDGNETSLGSAELSQVPAWVPKASDLSDGISTFHSSSGNQSSGQFSGKSEQSLETLKTYFEGEATGLGMSSSSSSSMNSNGTAVVTLGYSGGGKSLTIVITEKPGSPTVVSTAYSENK